MAYIGETFNLVDLPEDNQGDFAPVPPGWYDAVIKDASVATTKAGNGQYIKCRYDITSPTHEGRVVFANINIRNPNPKAEEIGRKMLGSLMRALGMTTVADTDDMIGGKLSIKLAIKPGDGQYEASNEVKEFKALNNSSEAPAPKTATAKTMADTGKAAPPWAAKNKP